MWVYDDRPEVPEDNFRAFHWSATESQLAAVCESAGYTVLRAAEYLPREQTPADPDDQNPGCLVMTSSTWTA